MIDGCISAWNEHLVENGFDESRKESVRVNPDE